MESTLALIPYDFAVKESGWNDVFVKCAEFMLIVIVTGWLAPRLFIRMIKSIQVARDVMVSLCDVCPNSANGPTVDLGTVSGRWQVLL